MKKFILLLAFVALASALVKTGSVHGKSTSHYIAKFTFTNSQKADDQLKDKIYMHYKAKNFGSNTYWVVYYDTYWYNGFHNSSASCQEKVDRASKSYLLQKDGDDYIDWTLRVYDKTRPHVWFVAMLNCPVDGKKQQVDVNYRVEFRNIDGSHLGYDQVGLKALYACFFVFFLLLTVAHGLGDVFLWLRNSFHHIVRLLLASLALMFFSNMFHMIHWSEYEKDGMGCSGCETFAGLLDNSAYIVFTLLLTMIASGWAITNQTLTRKWWVLGLFVANAITIMILFIIDQSGNGDNKAANITTLYEYTQGFGVATTFFGVIYLLVWMATVAYYVYAVYTSYRDETQYDKRLFYLIFGASYLVWFIVVPLFSLIAIAIDAWLRQRMMSAIHEVIIFLGMAVLVVLLWPTFVYKYFRIISPDLLSDNPSGL